MEYEEMAKFNIINSILESIAFNYLRGNLQLGYIAEVLNLL